MKKSAVALFVILTISDVFCLKENMTTSTLKSCITNFERCEENTNCCSEFCPSTGSRDRYCLPPGYANIDMEKIQDGQCAYYAPKNEELYSSLVDSFGLYFASHPLLPVDSIVEVEHNDKYINVVISNQQPMNMNSSAILELSRDAAIALDIVEEGLVDCSLQLLIADNDYYPMLKPIAIVLFYIGVMVVLL